MSELKLVSPLLDGFVVGNPISDHDGILCCPAMKESTDEKYILKIISIPASQVQLDALLLTGAYHDPAEAMDYFKEVSDTILAEAEVLNTLSKLEGYLPFEGCQVVPMEDGKLGYEIYLLSHYRRSLQRHTQKHPVTHLEAVNLGLDLCASLAIARRAGYLYVDLKPSNIFLSRQRQYRIGDLGFVKFDSLPYTSLPGKYRSRYSPAEVQDDMNVLNETVDTYAVGMILYQIYNEGKLPAAPLEPKDPFPHPSNADYEISSIIMKALDPDPANRWSDPMEMGQALVAYMQRNTVNNVPIVPPTGIFVHDEDCVAPQDLSEEEPVHTEVTSSEATETIQDADPEISRESAAAPEETEAAATPEESYAESEELDNAEDDFDFSIAFSEPAPENMKPLEPALPPKAAPIPQKPRFKGKSLIAVICVLMILICVTTGGFWFYQTQYLQNIRDLTLDGSQHELVVTIDTDVDESLLTAVCTDTYGNSTSQAFVNGTAVFTDLLPDSLYRIELQVDGFHELTGKTAEIFTTDALPTVVSMSAVTGAEDGSAIVNFTVDGDDPAEWVITCSAPDEEDILQTFTGHTVTVKGLTVGKMYTLTLGSSNGDQILGNYTLDFTAAALILAENLRISDYMEGTMTVCWDSPEDSSVESWNVRCYNEEGHEEVLQIAGTEIAFTGIDSTKSYTVEVTAAGMTQTNRITVSANPLTVTGLTVDTGNPDQLMVTWSHQGEAPDGGWLLMYALDEADTQQNIVKCETTTAVIDNRIPNSTYHFEIQAADSTSVFNSRHSFACPDVGIYSNQGLSADKVTAHLLVTPQQEGWTLESTGENFSETFHSGESISVVLKANDSFYLPEMDIDILYVIRDEEDNVLSAYISREVRDWKDLWYADNYHNGELTIPKVPAQAGNYTVSIYFDNLYMASADFSIVP